MVATQARDRSLLFESEPDLTHMRSLFSTLIIKACSLHSYTFTFTMHFRIIDMLHMLVSGLEVR